ncbi:MAG: hypothetical protein C4293_15495 [Nitrospiraceae bacterium]
MQKVLYLVSKESLEFFRNLIAAHPSSEQHISVVLIHDGVGLREIPARRVYVLSDDVASRNVTPAFPMISYAEMLRMMFDADSVVAL